MYLSGIGIFAAFFLLLLIVSETVPPSAESIPLVGLYHIGNMALVVLAMFLSSLVAKLQDMDEKKKLPYCLQQVGVQITQIYFIFCFAKWINLYIIQ